MADDPYGGVAGGGLKLKGGKIKKTKKKKKTKTDYIIEQASQSSTHLNSPSDNDDADYKDKAPTVKKTAAEIAFEKAQEQRSAERILKKASKTHKQRVEELNEYLGGLSEHYDIQKVSWTK